MEESDCSEHVSVDINGLNKVLACSLRDKLSDDPPSLSENCIFKVPGTLRRRNETSYEPKIVSIGPFHSEKERLQPMKKIKMWYLHCLLDRFPFPPEECLQHFVGKIRELAKRTINCYAEKIDLSENELVEMMIVDGCFLLELFRRDAFLVPRHQDDPIYNTSWMLENLYHDLILLENQIPWYVLECLFNLTVSVQEQEDDFLTKLVLRFFETMMLMTVPAEYQPRGCEIKHILDLLRSSLLSSSLNIEPTNTNWELFPPVTDLLRAGVKFEKGTPDDILNIKFSDGLFKIPPIKIRGNSESLFRNLIAYEQCDRHCTDKFTSYAVFLDCLINTSKDADLLCDEKIIAHALSTEDLAILFNGLYNDTLVSQYYYGEVSKKINEYHRSRWPKWRATLKRDYFNNPWSISSFIAAILILVFTFLQTLFTIRSY
ncbi:UPF0481 protein At3g47200-like isoform X2 [Rhododendron vialii]|uniref:UPF0481 protein At3g47200-like isoform X2 n=1 Tax=Rhododendron vialii TaxID=182163 RepID=UPI00265E4BC9|nr:UPF0481 protein At3g47200-like isoform X2 [Rhododendron vialii]XP_058194628.1 UPF0481 protein At3g47200-like isoform X2 [Rhododendron vialii]